MTCKENLHVMSHVVCSCQAKRLERPDCWNGLVVENDKLRADLQKMRNVWLVDQETIHYLRVEIQNLKGLLKL